MVQIIGVLNVRRCKIIIIGIIPPTLQYDYEIQNGPKTHHPFEGSDENRVRFTIKMNKLLKEYCHKYSFIYFNPYSYYTKENGTLKYELSDKTVHFGDNKYFLEKIYELVNSFNN
jgi:hypothetical protein